MQYCTGDGVKAAIVTGVYTKIQSSHEAVLSMDGVAHEGCTLVDLQVLDEKGGFDLSHVPLSLARNAVGCWSFLPD